MKRRYRVHRFDIKMTADHSKQFLNSLEGEVLAIILNVTSYAKPFQTAAVGFLLIVEKVS